jgi:patatin-like phospholipase/acyl hydrolase
MTHRILSIDGGGSRALIPVCLLQRLLDAQPDCLDQLDVIAGTSTSGITALLMAYAQTPEQGLSAARELWIEGHRLFSDGSDEFNLRESVAQALKPVKSVRALWDANKKLVTAPKLRGVSALTGVCAYFSQDALESALHEIFGDSTISDLNRTILVPAINVGDEDDEHWTPDIIHNLDDRYGELTLVETALRIAAMPILFPMHSQHIDAAMLANNPALTAVAKLLEYNPGKLKDMRVLSIGTGENPLSLQGSDPDLGYAGWLMDHKIPFALMQACIETNSELTNYQCQQILGQVNHHRVNPRLARPWLMHEHKAQYIVEATDIAEDTPIEATLDWLVKAKWVSAAASQTQPA